jgi:polyisoprenyl-phosphate glycosyltransferase
MNKKFISIVSPVYNEEGGIEEFYNRCTNVLKRLIYPYEIILINDGSKDDSLLQMLKLSKLDKNLKIINFSRNFGHQTAITAGMDYAKGDAVIVMDSDLQDPPEIIPDMLKLWEDGYDIVNARRKTRSDGFFKDYTAVFFYKFLNKLISNKIPENVGDYRLMGRNALDTINQIRERDRYVRGLTSWIGFKQGFVEFDRDKRFSGHTHYPLSKMLALAFNAIFSFSNIPMKLANYTTILFLCCSIIIGFYTLYQYIIGNVIPGWTSITLLVLSFSTIQMFILGILSEYVGRIYNEVKKRPLYIVADTINFNRKNI